MMPAPLRTLTGRMVLVTVVAVLLSYAVAFALYANERGAAIRRASETALIERVEYMVERVRSLSPADRALLSREVREFGLRLSISDTPAVRTHDPSGVAGRIARTLGQDLGGVEVRAAARVVEAPLMGREPGPPHHAGPLHEEHRRLNFRNTEVRLSIALDGAWLNARARLPPPRPLPLNVIIAALLSVLIVGVGAALVSRQIGQPLAKLADAARALGQGETNVAAPVSGPEDVRRASTSFNSMANRLGRQLNRQKQMLWALSHDLRTPITALKLRLELIEDEQTRERLNAPIAEMERLTEQALSLARAGASEEPRVRVDMAEIVRTLCGELQDIGISVVADAPEPVLAECRPFEIVRAMRNLAENAAKYAGAGIMRVRRAANGEAEISVLDEGPGVPADQIARLSEPFFRADAARGENQNGAGLGLAIAQAIAESQGGRLVLENRTPRGFSATLTLPG